MVPPWLLRTVSLHLLVFRPEHRSVLSFVPFPVEYVQLVLTAAFALLIVLVMSRLGVGRSEFWWLAGGLFVVAAAATSVAIDVPLSGEYVFLDLISSLLYGYWVTIFAFGALAWRRWMPTYPPASWARESVVVDGDDTDDGDDQEH